MYDKLTLSAVIPCLDEEEGIGLLLERMPEVVDEIVVVDNGSTDRTGAIAAAHGAKVVREEVRGYGRAYKTGFANATGDLIVTLDGDLTYPPEAIPYLLEARGHLELDFLSASRFPLRDRRAMSLKHALGNLVLTASMSALYFRWIRDSQSGMWLFRRALLPELALTSDGMGLSEEIKIEAIRHPRIRFAEVPIRYASRVGAIKLNPWRDGLANLGLLVRKRFG